MVLVDRAPSRSGWAHVWTRAVVITIFIASAASVLPNGSTDFPLAHSFEATASATDSTTRFDVAPAIVSSLLILGHHLHAWSLWVVSVAGFGCLCYYWRSTLEAFGRLAGTVIGPSPRWLNHEARMYRLGWIRWFAFATYLAVGLGGFGYVYDGGLGDFALKDFGSKISDGTAHISVSKCVGAGLPPHRGSDFRLVHYDGFGRFRLKSYPVGKVAGASNLSSCHAGSLAQRGDAGLSRGPTGYPTQLAEPAARLGPVESGHLDGSTLPAPRSALKIAGSNFAQLFDAGLSRRLTGTRPAEPTHRRGVAGFSGDLRDLRLVIRLPKEALRTVHLPLNVSPVVLLIEIGAGIFFFYFFFFLILAAVATEVLVTVGTSKRLRPLLEVGAVASIVYVYVGLARWLWTGGAISWAPLVTASALVFWSYTTASTPRARGLCDLVLMAGSASVTLLWMPWVTAAAWAVVTVLRAVGLSYEFGRVLLMVAEVQAALGRGKAEEEEHRRERRLALVKNHLVPYFALRLDEASKYLTAKIAAGWAEPTDGKDPTPLTWRGCAFSVAATTAALPSRWLLGMGLGLVCTSTPSWILYGLVLLTLTPRRGTLLWGWKVGRPLVSYVCRVIDFALSRMFPPGPKATPTSAQCFKVAGSRCGQPPPVQRRALSDLFNEYVDVFWAGVKQFGATQEEDGKWLSGEAASHVGEVDEEFEARIKDGDEIVNVWVVRRDYTLGKSLDGERDLQLNRALCLSFDRTQAYVVSCGSLLKAEAPPAQLCGADRETVTTESTAADPLEQYRRQVNEARRRVGSDLNIATALGLMEVGDVDEQVKGWLSASDAGEALNQRLETVAAAARTRRVYLSRDVAKWAGTAGDMLNYTVSSRASSTNSDSLAERMSLVGHLFAACPVWSEAFTTSVPVLPELQQDAIVLGKAASMAIRVPLSETMSEEAGDLGYVVAESAEFVVPPNWDTTWNETQVGHAAGAVREYLAEVQTKLLKRLWDALTLSATLPAINEGGSSAWLEAWVGPEAGSAGLGGSGSASTICLGTGAQARGWARVSRQALPRGRAREAQAQAAWEVPRPAPERKARL